MYNYEMEYEDLRMFVEFMYSQDLYDDIDTDNWFGEYFHSILDYFSNL